VLFIVNAQSWKCLCCEELYACEAVRAACESTLQVVSEVIPACCRRRIYIQPFTYCDEFRHDENNNNGSPRCGGDNSGYKGTASMKHGITAGMNVLIRELRD
jgi:hypothetical protein